MISLLKRKQILSLLDTGLSVPAVAARARVNRNTVASIRKKSKTQRCSACTKFFCHFARKNGCIE